MLILHSEDEGAIEPLLMFRPVVEFTCSTTLIVTDGYEVNGSAIYAVVANGPNERKLLERLEKFLDDHDEDNENASQILDLSYSTKKTMDAFIEDIKSEGFVIQHKNF